MSDQNHPPFPTPGEEHFYQASTSQAQVAPLQPLSLDEPISQPTARTPAFPLMRMLPTRFQLPAMLLYAVLLIIAFTSCLLALSTPLPNHPDTFQQSMQLFQELFLVYVLVPMSTLLCALFFGSWRSTLVSCISIYISIQLTHLLNNQFWSDMSPGSFIFLFPVALVTFLVGLSYELRKRPGLPESIPIILVASIILAFTLIFVDLDPNASYDGIGFFVSLCCTMLYMIPAWIFLAVLPEIIIPRALAPKRKHSGKGDKRRWLFNPGSPTRSSSKKH